MFSHVTLGTHDLPRAVAFYDAVLAPLGIERVVSR
jgi:catechol 2,3-dioxygenase-like lactoylglutathione lyase family enzyme